ncbi:MAG: helicase-associated domain-containing protein [Blastocatellia bacterium]|nr:helicase-associated domain-containing protein [Blastocatellia bacterium]
MSRFRTDKPKPISAAPAFETVLLSYNADAVKQFARTFAGSEKGRTTKDACIRAIIEVLANPAAIRNMVSQLSDFERNALALHKLRGTTQAAKNEEWAVECLLLDWEKNSRRAPGYYYGSHRSESYEALNQLLRAGLVFHTGGSYLGLGGYYGETLACFVDARILREIGTVTLPAIRLKPVEGPSWPDWVKRPSEITLRMVAFHQALQKTMPLALTAKALPAKPTLAKLNKLLNWEEAGKTAPPGQTLPEPLGFMMALWKEAGLLRFDTLNRTIEVQETAAGLLARPFAEQAAVWLRAYRSVTGWFEGDIRNISMYFDSDRPAAPTKVNGLRAGLLLTLATLSDKTGWYRIKDLSDALYHAIGSRFSLGYLRTFQGHYSQKAADIEEARKKVETERHEAWNHQEHFFLAFMLVGPLLHLGIVELAYEKGKNTDIPTLFRLTEAGRQGLARLYGQTETTATQTTARPEKQPCWMIQPNFDVVVYLEQALPEQLALIERVAERRQLDAATATYRLTREATYLALEAGLQLEQMLADLQASSLMPVPEAVSRSIRDWAERRERIAVHLLTNLLEFDSAGARDDALTATPNLGKAIGDRYVLVNTLPKGFRLQSTIAYEPAPPRCISVSESGGVTIDPELKDLLISGELTEICLPDAKNPLHWRITETSAKAARKKGWMTADLLTRLAGRAKRPLPKVLELAIRCWTGENQAPPAASLERAYVLRVPFLEMAEALDKSPLFKPFLAERLGPHAFLAHSKTITQLQARLDEFGFSQAGTSLTQMD